MVRLRLYGSLWLLTAALLGCGGGNGATGGASGVNAGAGSGVGTLNPTSKIGLRLSGTISVPPFAAVDTDLNDGNQANRRANDDPNNAQPLTSPVLLVGTVNQPGTGPTGASQASGDVDDWFSIDLLAGQTIELESSAEIGSADIDLYVLTKDGAQIGFVNTPDTRSKCVQISRSGTYHIDVHAFMGASVYNLRVADPGGAGQCNTVTAALNFNPQELLAVPKAERINNRTTTLSASGRSANTTHVLPANMLAAGIQLVSGAGSGPILLRLPSQKNALAQGLSRLAQTPRSTAQLAAISNTPAAVMALKYAKYIQTSGAYLGVHPNWRMDTQALAGTFPPNDPSYSLQRWHYDQINLAAALNRLGSLAIVSPRTPLVAVIDDGVMLDHPDLYPQLISAGRTFFTNLSPGDGNIANGDNPAQRSDNPIFHGTHVAGLIAASTFDGRFGAGIAPMAQILPLRVFQPGHGANTLDIVNAMLYAAGLDNNSGTLPPRRADIINLSLGSDVNCPAAYQNAIDRVRTAGVMVVAAAGNSSRLDLGRRVAVSAPANCRGVIAVGALDIDKKLAAYSNTGSALSLVAPGGGADPALGLAAGGDAIYSTIGSFNANGARVANFGALEGTSMAAPHVSGTLALMRYINPQLSPAQIDMFLTTGRLSDDLGATGRDNDFGMGLINARKAVEVALETTTSIPAPTLIPITAQPSSLDLGSFRTSAQLELRANVPIGSTLATETVASVVSASPAVQISPTQVDATGQGTYTLSVDRSLLSPGTHDLRITVNLKPTRTLSLSLSVTRVEERNTALTTSYGPLYVVLIDPDRNDVVATVQATVLDGRYTWSYNGYTRNRVSIIAGADLDNDDYICQRGEPCSTVLNTNTAEAQALTLNSALSRTTVDLQVTPTANVLLQSHTNLPLIGVRRQVPGTHDRAMPHTTAALTPNPVRSPWTP
ncbi:S8 family serine peptidase [Leptothrix ochracea]|uniref:S8 family serine peptidase n=1 Tax=Leptothrix ochracea TaxID=735331 RepID=UPI0034E27541